MPRIWAAIAGIGLTIGLAAAVPATAPTKASPAGPASQCLSGERVLYSCQFGKSVGSVCANRRSAHYRYGPPGQPGMDIANQSDWSNIHTGSVRGQGAGGFQEHVRFTSGQVHYIVFNGMDGALSDRPGRAYSGISVQSGLKGEKTLATLACTGKASMNGSLLDGVNVLAPAGADLSEQVDGPFDAWF